MSELQAISPPLEKDLSPLKFRVVTVNRQRRGIKLEEIYWQGLSDLARQRQCKLADIVAECESSLVGDGNLTARLRYVATSYLRDQLLSARERSNLLTITGQVRACPSPAFALSGDKRIVSYNQPFLAYVQSRFQKPAPAQGLRLSFDIQFSELVERLKQSPGAPQPANFTIGVSQQLARGRLNAALACLCDEDVVIGFVLV